MNVSDLQSINQQLQASSPTEIIQWAVSQGHALVTTNFRPYESVILHMAVQVLPTIPILWVDHGSNLPETYLYAEASKRALGLNIQAYVPKMTSAHWLALNGGNIPMPDEVEKVESFSRIMKLEPFERGMNELAPKVWITALRREQNPQRASTLQTVMWDPKFNCLKINPILDWLPLDLGNYISKHQLPNEMTYYDPAKGDEKHECGLHAKLITDAK
jgi:phosphoadenosine phosphosulfate reductase